MTPLTITVWFKYRYNNETKGNRDLSTDANRQASELAELTTNLDNERQAKVAVSSLPADIQSIIINYRKEHPDHGYRRIEDYLRDKYFIKVARKQIRKVLKVHGLEKILDSSFDKEAELAKGSRCFEASRPRELYQMDLSYVYTSGLPVFYLILIIDDYSRFCVGYNITSQIFVFWAKYFKLLTVANL